MSETVRQVVLTEAAIQKGIVDLLKHLGYATYHTRYSIGSDSGFPDVIGVREDGKLIAVECKGPNGRLRPDQAEWIDRFGHVPGCVLAAIVGGGWMDYDEALERIREATE
jgi:hypothetical protein